MVILHIICVNKPYGNGVIDAVKYYTRYEAKGNKVAIFDLKNNAKKYFDEDTDVLKAVDYSSLELLPKPFNKPDLVIFNEVYKPEYLKLYKKCIEIGCPYVVIPHGCLTAQAQSGKKLKKKTANILFFNRFLKKASAIQYLNDKEKHDSAFKDGYSIISGNGVELKNNKNKSFEKNLVYIGRYDVKVKGLDLIVKTVAKNRQWFIDNDVTVQLYGRNSGNGYEITKSTIEDSEVSSIVKLNDAVYGKEKEKILLESYAFIQVSRHEGQPMGIMEALSYGLPCIVTYGTSFGKYVNDKKCGIGINFDEKELFDAIKKMIEKRDFRNDCAKNAIIVEDDYEWGEVIKRCLKEYEVLV